MKNKELYYTPEIGDLRVGWEGLKFSHLDGKWNKFTISRFDLLGILDEEENDCYEHHIKASYLTKEQIEAEGWEDGLKANKELYVFSCQLTDNIVRIEQLGTVAYPDRVIFEGECKSINEFRYICKLLHI